MRKQTDRQTVGCKRDERERERATKVGPGDSRMIPDENAVSESFAQATPWIEIAIVNDCVEKRAEDSHV